ncbi:MAG: hypothetical protein ABSF14_07980 [Terriglobia bacterium]|jgi:hypothetical protein
MFMKMRRARFFAQFILSGQSEILRFAQNDSEGLRMTAVKHFPAACLAPPLQGLPDNSRTSRPAKREAAARVADALWRA